MKGETFFNIIAFCFILVLLSGLIYWGVSYTNMIDKETECLRPFAEEYCEEKGLVLKGQNRMAFFCSEDMRSESQRYSYLSNELKYCSGNDVEGEETE